MPSRSRTACLALAFISALTALPASAQPPSQPAPPSTSLADAKAAAKAAADRGQALFDEGRHDEAIAAFREADQAFHAPTFILMIARAHEKRGRLRDARAAYQQVVDEQLVHYAPQVFFDAQAAAKTELAALLPRIPTLLVTVTGALSRDVTLLIDGQPATLAQASPQDPGEHTVAASAPGREPATQTVTLQEGANARITVELKVPPPPAPKPTVTAPPPPLAVPPPPPPQAQATPVFTTPSRVLLALGGLGLGVGTLTAVMAANDIAQLEKQCPGKVCYDDAAIPYDSEQTLTIVSTLSFIAGGAAAASGIGLLIWDMNRSPSPARTSIVAGPGWVGVKGRF